ncbi:uncharacterized protein [Littorina saxatilis]|uniref:uncharacterized protein isoform X2 n=1 Tax=Littorina saxatilis TaxID=31220 RepID=UPI0038B41CDB
MKTLRSKSCILSMGIVVCVATFLIFFRWTDFVTSVPPYIYPCIQNGTWGKHVHPSQSDTLGVENWPRHQLDDSDPLNVPYTVHYLWCGDAEAKFRFKDYLSLTSVVRVLQPVKVILHYTVLPRDDSYNTWSTWFAMSTPALHLQQLKDTSIPCGSEEMLDAVLAILEPQGGIFVGQGVILARAPTDFNTVSLATHFSDSPDKTRGVLYANRRFPDPDTRLQLLELILSSPASCVSEDDYNQDIEEDPFCISLSDSVLYPKDIMFSETRFAQLARWLFYGKRAPVVIKKDPDNLIPRISHYIKLSGQNEYSSELNFNHFLNMLSALYIGGFRHVYLHAEEEPRGQWWEELQSESVTWVKIEPIDTVFRQDIRQKAHVSDVIRCCATGESAIHPGLKTTDVRWGIPGPPLRSHCKKCSPSIRQNQNSSLLYSQHKT